MKDYSELKMLAEAATPGEWACSERHDGRFWHIGSGNQAIGATHAAGKKSTMAGTFEANAKFIAKANPKTVLELIAEVESLKKDAARYRWLRKNNIYAHVQVTQKDGSEPYVYDSELDRSVDWAIYATKDHK